MRQNAAVRLPLPGPSDMHVSIGPLTSTWPSRVMPFGPIKRRAGEGRYGFFDLDWVHGFTLDAFGTAAKQFPHSDRFRI
jgi:hypothetical protein